MAKKKIIVSCKIITFDFKKGELKGVDCQYIDENKVIHKIDELEVGYR